MSNDRFDKLEQNPIGKALDPSSAGATGRRFRRWLEFKGEKRTELTLEAEKPKAVPAPGSSSPSVFHPRPDPSPRSGYTEEQLAAKRAERALREEELRAAQERARRARNTLLWIFGGLGAVGFLIYLLSRTGGGALAEIIVPIIIIIVATIARSGRVGGGRWGRWWDD